MTTTTIKYAARSGPNVRNTMRAIAQSEDFRASALSARTDRPGYYGSFGSLPEDLIQLLEADRPAYIVFSYETPIAWYAVRDGADVLVVPDCKYSVTTSRHQSLVRRSVDHYVES